MLTPASYDNIRELTSQIHGTIRAGTFDSPSWNLIRVSKLAGRIYAPLGTLMTLGDYVRVTRTFLEAFREVTARTKDDPNTAAVSQLAPLQDLCRDLNVSSLSPSIDPDSLTVIRHTKMNYRVLLSRMSVSVVHYLVLSSYGVW